MSPLLQSPRLYDPTTTVSPSATQEDFTGEHAAVSQTTTQLPLSLQTLSWAHCKTRGKNDSKGKMVCRLVCDDCNMCRVDVYQLPQSFRSLSALFFLLPSPSFLSPFLLPAPVLPLFLSGGDQSLAQTISHSRKGVWCSE